jgi:UPF0755 protein
MILFMERDFVKKILVIGAMALLIAISTIFYVMQPLVKPIGQVNTVIIPQGASTVEIADMLSREGIIKDPLVFRILTRVQRMDNTLQAGEYEFPVGMSVSAVLNKVAAGETITYTFTIPEGFTIEQIASLLAEKKLADRERFLSAARKGIPGYGFLNTNSQSGYVVEGFLFPDTYRIPKGMKEEDILKVMLKKFDTTVTSEMRAKAASQGLSMYQLVTLASLVEREARAAADRPIIATVFLHRLQIEMPLQSCATIQYILGTPKLELTVQDTKIESPYNTYLYPGLPPGPIANPGLASINAVLNPAVTNVLYFVAKPDGAHIFSPTYEEHLAAIEQADKLSDN